MILCALTCIHTLYTLCFVYSKFSITRNEVKEAGHAWQYKYHTNDLEEVIANAK